MSWKQLSIIALILANTLFLPCSLLVSLPILGLLQFTQLSLLLPLISGLVLLVINTAFNAVTFSTIFQYNHLWLKQFLTGHWHVLLAPYPMLVSLPIALILAAFFSGLINYNRKMQREIARIGKGQHDLKPSCLSDRQIEKAMGKLRSQECTHSSILGVDQNTGEAVTISDKNANLHTLAIGTTGSGKTTTICNIVESCIQRELPLIYVDGKGDLELARRIEQYAQKQQRKFYCFSMVGESVKYNPLASGGITSKKDRIIALRSWSEEHYRKIAEGYLQTVFALFEHFQMSVDLFHLGEYLLPEAWCKIARGQRDSAAIDKISQLEAKQKDISGLLAEIDNMVGSEIGQLFNCDDGEVLTLKKALDENAIVYFCLQPLAYPTYAESLGKLIINDIKALAASQLRSAHKKKLYCIFDEFSVFAGDQIINLINQGRSAGIHAILSTQSLSDIERVDPALLGQVLNNCNNYLIQRQNNHEDAERLSNIIGTVDTFQITSQVAIHQGTTGAGTVKPTKEYIIHPDQIKRLKLGEAIFVSKQDFAISQLQVWSQIN